MTYNMTAFDTSNNIFEMYSAVNTSSNNYLVIMSLFALFIITFVTLNKRSPAAESLMGTSMFVGIISLIFVALELIDPIAVVACAAIFIISSIGVHTNKD